MKHLGNQESHPYCNYVEADKKQSLQAEKKKFLRFKSEILLYVISKWDHDVFENGVGI